jgi:D-psicose/D-tagatose/L-ribulose 3-epimerase
MIRSRRTFLQTLAAALAASRALARVGSIEIGVCAGANDLEKAVRYGFDYLEPGAAAIEAMSEADFQVLKTRVLASPVRCECFNSMIRTLRVVGEDVRWDELTDFLERLFGRCRELGGSIVVWGSAGSRNVPAGFSRERAWDQIKQFLSRAGEMARAHQLTVAIEPLRHQESNIINTGAEALKLVREVNHPRVRMIIDYYHLREENEDPQIIWEARREIVHFHFANPNGRRWPRDPNEDPEYARFFELVKKIDFRGGISIEAAGTFEQDAAASLAFFREELASGSGVAAPTP